MASTLRDTMKMLKRALALTLLATLVGCAAPIYNVSNAPVTIASSKQVSASQVREAIVRAGASLGWVFKDSGPDKLTGTLHLRTHTAVIDIPYSAQKYSINYVSSQNLNASNGTIHKNYNGWITNLTRAIDVQLSSL